MSKLSKRSILISCFLFFFILAAFSFLIIRIAPEGEFYAYDVATFNLFFYMPLTVWVAIFGLGGLLILLALHDFDGLSPKFTYGLMLLILLVIFTIFYGRTLSF